MTAKHLRTLQDIKLSEKLLNDPTIQSANAAIARHEQQGQSTVRRQLLSTSVNLSANMSPTLHKLAQHCAQQLGVTIPIELYAYSSPQHNAACVKAEAGKLFIMFSSSLLNDFTEDELCFVMGHELGHHLYQHHDIPAGYILKGKQKPDPALALRLTSWSRYAEFSADRAGAHCCKDFTSVAGALFKLASGVTNNIVRFNLDDFLEQVNQMQMEDKNIIDAHFSNDWFMTHPFSPLRVKALELFYQSELAKSNGYSVNELELGIQDLMQFMEPRYLEVKTNAAKHMKSLLFAGCILVANADGAISEAEIHIFEQFFGKDSYHDKINIEQLNEDLIDRARQVRDVASIPRRMQVIRDICTIATINNNVTLEQRQLIETIGKHIEVPISFIDKILSLDYEVGLQPKA